MTLPAAQEAQSVQDRYVRQMRVGFDALRFERELEAEYRSALLAEAQRPAYVLNLASAVVWGGFAVFDFIRLDIFSGVPITPDVWMLLIARWLVLVVLVLGLFPSLTRRMPLDVRAFATYLLMGLSAGFTAVLYRLNGLPSVETMQVVIVMSAFVPMGVRFYGSLIASFSIVGFSILIGALVLPPDINAQQSALVAVMLLAVPIAGIGGYLREHAHRHQFLLAALLAHQAQFDSLTNLANRRLFERHANAALAHATRTGEPLTMAVIDIDHFKQFNDLHGHAAGDAALRHVADIIADSARRPMDMAARLGGEEFAILLFGTDLARAQPLLEVLRQRIATLDIAGQNLTISIGAASLGSDGLEGLYRRADRLLYRSKEEGRNRVTVDPQPIPGVL
ncbi:MAG: GGDEF domain-containing protein [Hyphomicrobiales bacterium]|nr:MAG: GGDEF domain-containing protein [Hyphomicrobiales bacterium]